MTKILSLSQCNTLCHPCRETVLAEWQLKHSSLMATIHLGGIRLRQMMTAPPTVVVRSVQLKKAHHLTEPLWVLQTLAPLPLTLQMNQRERESATVGWQVFPSVTSTRKQVRA